MDCLTFITKLVEALAWPATVVLVAFMSRKQVLELIPSLRELTLPGGIAARFEGKLEALHIVAASKSDSGAPELSREVVSADLNVRYSVAAAQTVPPEADVIATEYNPAGVVMEVWQQVEAKIREILVDTKIKTFLTLPEYPVDLINTLREHGLASQNTLAVLEGLRKLRTVAAHAKGNEITKDSATRYHTLASWAVASLHATAEMYKNKK